MKYLPVFKILLSGILLLTLCSCANVNYIGNSHSPTQNVELFYEEEEVPDTYKVIGKAVASARNDKQARNALVKRAQKEGADALLIEDLSPIYYQNSNNNTTSKLQVNAKFYKKLSSSLTGAAKKRRYSSE